jgi:DNA-binding transcriptional LysR family regulator
MEIYQLRTFVVVAREGSITRASDLLFLSQPAVSAHIKSLEDELGLTLFDRVPRGMSLTAAGELLLVKADDTLATHRAMLDEARRIKGQVCGTVRIGSVRNQDEGALPRLLQAMGRDFPSLDVKLHYGTSAEIADQIRHGELDAGLLFTLGSVDDTLDAIDLRDVGVFLAAPSGMVSGPGHPDWHELAQLPWVCPAPGTCCSNVAEEIFAERRFRPKRVFGIDLESVTRTLIAGGVGIGLLHQETAFAAARAGEVELLGAGPCRSLRLVLATARERRHDPVVGLLLGIARSAAGATNSTIVPK